MVVEAIVALAAGGVLAYVLPGTATRSGKPAPAEASRGAGGAPAAVPSGSPSTAAPVPPPSAPAPAAALGPRKATQTAGKFRD